MKDEFQNFRWWHEQMSGPCNSLWPANWGQSRGRPGGTEQHGKGSKPCFSVVLCPEGCLPCHLAEQEGNTDVCNCWMSCMAISSPRRPGMMFIHSSTQVPVFRELWQRFAVTCHFKPCLHLNTSLCLHRCLWQNAYASVPSVLQLCQAIVKLCSQSLHQLNLSFAALTKMTNLLLYLHSRGELMPREKMK